MMMTTPQNAKVLVLDGQLLSALAIVRSLGRQGIQVSIGSIANQQRAISSYSRYAKQVFDYPDSMSQPDEFVERIVDFLSKNNFDLLIPVTEDTALPLMQQRERIEKYCLLALPEQDILQLAIDKQKTFAIAQELGVPIPRSVTVDSLDDLEKMIAGQQYPVVIKPTQSVAALAGDVRAKLTVHYAFNDGELRKICQDLLRYSPCLLQTYFQGDGVGVEVLANHGDILLAFQHQRLHELPLTGGGSCLRKSVPVHPQLLAYTQRLMKQLNWHGVAMVEFKHHAQSNQSCLMEINGRFWGSLPLAVSAGADFPYTLYRLLVLGDSTQHAAAKTGHLNRKLKEDLYWYLIVLLRRDKNPLIVWPSVKQLIVDFFSLFSPKHRFDSFAYDDPLPFAIDNLRTVEWAYELVSGFLSQRYWQVKFQRQKNSGKVVQSLKSANSVLFLCYGNINRSALAEKCLQQKRAESSNLQIESAGFHAQAQRPADANMVKIAATQGIDLSAWSSKTLTETMVTQADVILVMEIAHFRRLVDLYPHCKHKTYLLGSVSSDAQLPLEIADPYGQTTEKYAACFKQINFSTQTIAQLLG